VCSVSCIALRKRAQIQAKVLGPWPTQPACLESGEEDCGVRCERIVSGVMAGLFTTDWWGLSSCSAGTTEEWAGPNWTEIANPLKATDKALVFKAWTYGPGHKFHA